MSHPRHWGQTQPEKLALLMAGSGASRSYAKLENQANRVAQLLRRHGLKRGDSLAVLMENDLAFMEIFWGAQRSGLYFVPVSWRLKPEEIAYILTNSGARILFTSALHAQLAQAAAPLADVTQIFIAGANPPGFVNLADALAAMPATPIADESLGRDMMYSSGTTGRPKGVKTALPSGEITAVMPVMAFMSKLYQFDTQTIFLCTSPLYHAAGSRYALIAGHAGATVIIMERFDAEQTLALIARHRITHVSLVPAMFVRLLKLPSEIRAAYDLSSLKMVLHGTGPCGRAVKQAMMDWLGPILYENYGATEGNGLCAISPQEWLEHPGSVGQALVGEIHVLRPDLTECEVMEDGLVYFAGGPGFEYHGDPEKTSAAHIAQGWSTLGDIGHLDADGFLYLTDRNSNMIISGGVNIYPQEVEDLLLAHPKVLDAAVFGIADEEFGEAVHAAVHPLDMEAAGDALAAELIAYCRQHIATYKCPRGITFCNDLPRHETGKIYKHQLRHFANAAPGRKLG